MLLAAGLSLLVLTLFCLRGWWRRYFRRPPDWMTWDDWLVAGMHLRLASMVLIGLWLAFLPSFVKALVPK